MCRAGLRTLMATGDYHHTALAVATAAGMNPPEGQIIMVHKAPETKLAAPPNTHAGMTASDMVPPRQSPIARAASLHKHLAMTASDSSALQRPRAVAVTQHRHSGMKPPDSSSLQSRRSLQKSVSFAHEPHIQAETAASLSVNTEAETADIQADSAASQYRGLVFQSASSSEGATASEDDALQALTAIAQVQPFFSGAGNQRLHQPVLIYVISIHQALAVQTMSLLLTSCCVVTHNHHQHHHGLYQKPTMLVRIVFSWQIQLSCICAINCV